MQISSLLGNKPSNENYLACFLIRANLHKPNMHYLHETTPYISPKIQGSIPSRNMGMLLYYASEIVYCMDLILATFTSPTFT